MRIVVVGALGEPLTLETVNKQLNDKERVAAALENSSLLDVSEHCVENAVTHVRYYVGGHQVYCTHRS